MSSKSYSSSVSTTTQLDERNFAEGGSAVAGQGSSIAYPSSISVFGSPGSTVGDITFVSHAPAENGIGDQLSGIMAPALPSAMPTKKADYKNYLIIGVIAAGAFLIWKGL